MKQSSDSGNNRPLLPINRTGQSIVHQVDAMVRCARIFRWCARIFRWDSPCNSMWWELCTRRSRIASARIGSGMRVCQIGIGNCGTSMVAMRPWRSSKISSKNCASTRVSGSHSQSSKISRSALWRNFTGLGYIPSS